MNDSWFSRAACRGHTEIFFENEEDQLPEGDLAKSICQGCPVRLQCLDWALSNRETHGIWGGLDGTERKTLKMRWTRFFPRVLAELDETVNEIVDVLAA